MKPFNINLAIAKPKPKISTTGLIAALFFVVILLTAWNVGAWIKAKNGSNRLQTKIDNIERIANTRQHNDPNPNPKLSPEESENIIKRTHLIYSIVLKDVYPWDKVLDLLESSLPKGISLQTFIADGPFDRCTITGNSTNIENIPTLISNLDQTTIFENPVLDQLKVPEKKTVPAANNKQTTKYPFNIGCRLAIDIKALAKD